MSLAVSPTSLAEAIRLLAEQPSLVPVAGCTDLMVPAGDGGGGVPVEPRAWA